MLTRIEIHCFTFRGWHILLDVRKSSVFRIDELTHAFIDRCGEIVTEDTIHLLGSEYGKSKVKKIVSALVENKILVPTTDKPPRSFSALKPEISRLAVNITYDCNMACGYCYGRDGPFSDNRTYMDRQTAKAMIDCLLKEFPDAKTYEIIFHAAEPMLHFELVKFIVNYCKQIGGAHKKRFTFSLCTNGTLLNSKAISFLSENDFVVQVSVDGCKELNDDLRRFWNGKGSYDVVVPKVKQFIKLLRRGMRARATITHRNVQLTQIVSHLLEIGFEDLKLYPVMSKKNEYALTAEDIKQMKREYNELALIFIQSALTRKPLFLQEFICPLRILQEKSQCFFGCSCGSSLLSISPNGDIYPCDNLDGHREFLFGNVKQGIDHMKLEKFVQRGIVDNRSKCQECWARYLCGGGSYCDNMALTGNILVPDTARCELRKHLIELATYIYLSLQEKDQVALDYVLDYPFWRFLESLAGRTPVETRNQQKDASPALVEVKSYD